MTYLVYLTGWILLVPAILLAITGMTLRSTRLRAWAAACQILAAIGLGQWDLQVHDWLALAVSAGLLAVACALEVAIYCSTSPRSQVEELMKQLGIKPASMPQR
jgi:uncharacterized membrane protein YhaH (DUF805 family)